ncbi:uncharacterized protein LOC123562193 [Mercenaria mercenaria]|uniref:uncharacterized protein LOC123562193 n=1 Tax=Mercenaria mercenaria TaxID=6596 RepID=UPI00234F37DD|nr:uncharacterized protein LOC123562193 [Mercenaria mercenaria]
MRILIFTFFIGFIYGAPAAPEVGLCEVCHLLVGEVQDLLTTPQTQDSVSSYVTDACAKLPSEEKDVCNSFMKSHSGSLFSRLIKDLTPNEFCKGLTDVCPAYIEEPEVEPMEEADDPTANPLECELCKLIVLGIDKIIKQNRSSAAINDTLEKFCDSLPDQIKDVCIKIEPAILKGLTTGFEPSVACKFATLCSVEGNEELSQIPCDVCYTAMGAIGIKDTESICATQTSCIKESDAHRQREENSKPEVEDTLECQICKFAVQAIDTIVGENRSVANINRTLENLCNSLPGELKDSCLNVEPDILKAVIGGIDPSKACDFLKICNDERKVPLSSQYIPCDVCKETLEAIAGEKGVRICYKFKDVCGLEAPELEQHEDRLAIPQEQFSVGEEENENLKEDARCELCKFTIQLLDESLENNATLTQISNTLYEICAALPAQFQALCPAIIPQLEKAVAAGLDPTNTCIASNFCTETSRLTSIEEIKCETCAQFVENLPDSTVIKVKNGICSGACRTRNRRSADQESPLLYKMKEVVKASNLKGITECELCKVFIRTLDGLAGENASIETVNKTVYEICTRLTGIQLQQVCLQDAPQLVVLLKNGLDPDKTCVAAKLCSSDEIQVKIQKRSVTEDKESALVSVIKEKERHNVGGVACDICEGVIQLLDQLLEENATDEKINQTLYNLCSGLPDGGFKDLCLQEIPTIMAAVEQGFDPQTICTDAGLCSGRSKVRGKAQLKKKIIREKDTRTNNVDSALLKIIVTKQKTQRNVGDIECDICEGVIEIVDQFLEDNATDEKINQTLYNLCSGLPDGAIKDLCTQNVVPAIMSVVEQGFDPEKTCSLAGLCNDNRQKKKTQEVHKQVKDFRNDREISNIEKDSQENGNLKDLKCEVCKAVIEEIDAVLKQNASIEKVNETIYEVCSELPGALQDVCLQAAPQIVDALKSGVDPTQACGSIGLCSSSSEASVTPEEEVEDINNNVGDIKCDICTLIIQGLDEIIGKNSSEQKINATIYKICNDLPGSAKSYCIILAPVVLKEVESGVDPTTACSVMKLCTSTDIETVTEMIENGGDVECYICELIIEALDNLVRDNASTAQINATMFALCDALPGEFKQFCTSVAPTIVKGIENGADPKTACTDLKLCTSAAVDEPEEKASNVGDIKCEICELIIQGIDSIVGNNASAEKINATIYTLCSDLPAGAAQKYCIMVAPTIVKAIEGGVDPDQACAALNLCSSSVDEYEENTLNVGDIKCEICELIIQGIDSIVGNNASAEKINATIYTLCSDLPSGAAQIYCIMVAPTIVKAIEGGVDPDQACAALNLCSSSVDEHEEKTSNVGDIKCEICELIIQGIDSIVGNNASAEKINATIYTLCSDLPSGAAQKYCIMVAPTIVKAIEGGVDPDQACAALKLCSSSVDEHEEKTSNVGDIKCEICELIIQGIDSIVGNNASAEKINATIYTLCSDLPSGAAQKYCIMVAPTIVKAIEGGVDPDQACSALNLCSSSETQNKVGDIKCEICELVIHKLDDLSRQNASKEKINSTIYQLCNDMGGTAKTFCMLLAPAVVKEVETGADPETACKDLKLCTTEAPIRNAISDVRKEPLDCNICARSLTAVYEDISGNYMKVERQLLQICSNLPGIFQGACESLVQNDNGRLFKKVLANYTPTSLCEMAKCQESEGPLKNHSF